VQVQDCVRVADKENKVVKVIDAVLTQVFGEKAACLIYKYLERNYSLKREEIAEKIDVFARGLEDFLSSGACVVERKILEDLQSSFGFADGSEFVHADFVDQMRFLTYRA
jgi:sulfur transfer complex TusBCD TusB component (DsrH family)